MGSVKKSIAYITMAHFYRYDIINSKRKMLIIITLKVIRLCDLSHGRIKNF